MALPYDFSVIPDDIKARYPERINPLLPTYYRFSIQRIPHTMYFCQSASLPTVTMSEVIMPTPFMAIKSPSKMDFDELSITFIIDEEMKNWFEIFNWMRSTTNVENYEEFRPANTHLSTANLVILNSTKNPKINVTFEGLYPRTLGSVDFTSTLVDPEPFQCTATFAYRNYNIEIL
jgi:hypothetical protein